MESGERFLIRVALELNMGELILFRPAVRAGRSNDAKTQSPDARILFFTGVRYKRELEPIAIAIESHAPPKGGMDGSGGGRRKRRG
jgi:hypothetical protein